MAEIDDAADLGGESDDDFEYEEVEVDGDADELFDTLLRVAERAGRASDEGDAAPVAHEHPILESFLQISKASSMSAMLALTP